MQIISKNVFWWKSFWQDSFQLRTAGQWAYGVPQRRSLSRCRHSLQRSRGCLAGLPRGWVVLFFLPFWRKILCGISSGSSSSVGWLLLLFIPWRLHVFNIRKEEDDGSLREFILTFVLFFHPSIPSIHPTTENRSKRSRLAAGGCAQQRGSRGISHGSI